MANTSIFDFTSALSKVLDYRNGTGNVNLYMVRMFLQHQQPALGRRSLAHACCDAQAHGGTNFGWSAGVCKPACC